MVVRRPAPVDFEAMAAKLETAAAAIDNLPEKDGDHAKRLRKLAAQIRYEQNHQPDLVEKNK
jgi:hypothetical protein